MVDAAVVRRVGKGRLLGDFAALVSKDRSCTADLLVYIGEIDRRKLYLEHAYLDVCVLYEAVSDVGGCGGQAYSSRSHDLSFSLHFGHGPAGGAASEWGASVGGAPY